MAFEHLKVKPLQRATSSWANSIVDALNQLYGNYEELRKRGTVEDPWELFYGGTGIFSENVFVKGKRVLKDGDPINLYDIFPPAKEKITQAINESKVPSSSDIQELKEAVAKESTQREVKRILEDIYGVQTSNLPRIKESVEEIKGKVLKIRMDEYGNIGVIIAEPVDEYGNVKVSPRDLDADLIPATGIIDTSTASSPATIITPSPGRKVDIRRAYVSTNSTNGEIYVKFKDTGKIITAIFPTKYGFAIVPAIRIPGNINEPVVVEWTGLDTGAKIVYTINYKEI